MITVMLNEAIQILKANAKILVTSTDVFQVMQVTRFYQLF